MFRAEPMKKTESEFCWCLFFHTARQISLYLLSELQVMKTITLEVSDPVAEKLERMSPMEKNALSETIARLVANRKSLEDIMHEASEQARKSGLTPKILEELLKDE